MRFARERTGHVREMIGGCPAFVDELDFFFPVTDIDRSAGVVDDAEI